MDVQIEGSKIYFYIGSFPVTATLVNMWIVMIVITFLCIFLTRNMKTRANTRRQHIAELIVSKVTNWVEDNMNSHYSSSHFPAFIAALFALSIGSSLISLLGLYPPTADLSVTLGWSVMVFIMITYTKIKTNRVSGYLKGFTKPIFVLTPLNVISELSTPISMGFRHFGNIASGQVVSALVYAALLVLNRFLFSWLPGQMGEILANIPFAQVGIPAFLSIYFDLFSGLMQAFIFCMLTMNYIAAAAEADE